MLEKLAEVSKVLLIPALVLYTFGFLSITAYLAQFGMVTFDILNARFLIAGLYSFVSLMLVIMVAWKLHRDLPLNKLFRTVSWGKRFTTYISFPTTLFMGCITVSGILNLGQSTTRGNDNDLIFHPVLKSLLGKYDFFGEFLQSITIKGVAISFVLKATAYISFYATLLAFISYFIFQIFSYLKVQRTINIKPFISSSKSEEGELPGEAHKSAPKKQNKYQKLSILYVDLIVISSYVSLLIYCASKLSVNLIWFESINSGSKLSLGLLFSWTYTSVLTVYFFLQSSNFPSEQLSFANFSWKNWFGRFLDFFQFQNAAQQLLIPILGSLYLFGAVIFPRIPFAIGGGQPRQVTIQTNIKDTSFKEGDFYIIEESSQYLFLVKKKGDKATAVQLNKNMVEYVQTKEIFREEPFEAKVKSANFM